MTSPGFSSETITPTNEWVVSDKVTEVAVTAGVSPEDDSLGLFAIFRENYTTGEQSPDFVKVPGAGAVTITSAPEGADVETSAQTGDLQFSSAKGVTGTLHLADDTVTISSTSSSAAPTRTASSR